MIEEGQTCRVKGFPTYCPHLAGCTVVVRHIYEDEAGDGSTCAFVWVPRLKNVVSVAVSDLEVVHAD